MNICRCQIINLVPFYLNIGRIQLLNVILILYHLCSTLPLENIGIDTLKKCRQYLFLMSKMAKMSQHFKNSSQFLPF